MTKVKVNNNYTLRRNVLNHLVANYALGNYNICLMSIINMPTTILLAR